jgi:hypothetical protein
MMARSAELCILAVLALGTQDPGGEGQPFEGALVLEAPALPEGPVAGDIVLSINGRPCTSLAVLRRHLADALGSPAKARVRRQDREIDLEWTPPTGTYRLTDGVTPAEQFRRSHAKDLEKPGVQAGLSAIQAAFDGKSRSALRHLERAREAGLTDVLLDWAEATVYIRQQNLPAQGEPSLTRAMKALENPKGADTRRTLGLCHIVASFRHFLHERQLEPAVQEWAAARAFGVDTSELARALGPALPQDSSDTWALRAQSFEDDPLDRSLAEWLAARAPTQEAGLRYAESARRLSGKFVSDPRLQLAGLIAKLEVEPESRAELQAFLARASSLSGDDRARGLDALAASFEHAGDRVRGFDVRLESLTLSATLARARSAAAAARRTGRYAPVLRFLRSLDNPKTNETSKKAYLALYGSLLTEALIREGVPSLYEGARLARSGRTAEAAALLVARSAELAQPELQIAAGIILRDAGGSIDPETFFRPEWDFWMSRRWEGPADALRSLQLQVRTGTERDSWLEESLDRVLKGVSPTIVSALKAEVAWRAKQPERAAALLRQAAKEAERPDASRGWIPIYAEGRVCETAQDYIEALRDRHQVGLELPPRNLRRTAGPAALGESDEEPRSLKQIMDESEAIVLGVVDEVDRPNRTFRLKTTKTLKGTDRGMLEVNFATAQDWHADALFNRLAPDQVTVSFFRKDPGKSAGAFVYFNRLFLRMKADPGPGWAVSLIERSMNRTFNGSATELATCVEDALSGRKEPPALQKGLPPLRRESFGVPPPEGTRGRMYVPDAEGFIRNWLILRPLALDGRASDHTEESQKEFFERQWFPGQNHVRPAAGDAPLAGRLDLQWEEYDSEEYFVDLGETPNSLSLGVVYLHSAKDIPEAILSIGSDDSSRWLVNGEEVLRVYAGRGIGRDQNRSKPVRLRAGLNIVMFSVINGIGPSAASLRVLGADGKPVPGLSYSLTP